MQMLKENSHRLVYALYTRSQDERVILMLSRVLNYEKDQLKKDMNDLLRYVDILEESYNERWGS